MSDSHISKDILTQILYFLSTRSGATAKEIKIGVCKRINLLPGDRIALSGRANEPKIFNTIQNTLRPSTRRDLIEYVRRDFYRITVAGSAYLDEKRADLAEIEKWFDEHFPGAFD